MLVEFKSMEALGFDHDPEDCRGRCRLPFEQWKNLQSLRLSGMGR